MKAKRTKDYASQSEMTKRRARAQFREEFKTPDMSDLDVDLEIEQADLYCENCAQYRCALSNKS